MGNNTLVRGYGRSLCLLLLGLGVLGCQGDRDAESWFAPDPQLVNAQRPTEPQPEPTNPTPPTTPQSPSATPSTTASPDTNTSDSDVGNPDIESIKADDVTVRLPATFPADIPSYPQAQLLTASYRAGQGTGSTDWESDASPQKVASFYQQFLIDKNWELEQRYSKNTPEVILLKDDLEARLTFPVAAQFRIAYRDTSIAIAAPEPTAATASSGLLTDPNKAVADLQALGVLPTTFEPGEMINRRTFARWLLSAYNRMYRDRPTLQIRPAAATSQPAFQDIPTSDPDFVTIQGLAEAGIIPSRLNGTTSALLFQPDSLLTRETLLLWKVPLDRRLALPKVSVQNVQQVWGFQDVEQVAPNVLPTLFVDYENGDRANVLRVFGYTQLFQPKKGITQQEAAIALWSFGFQGEGINAVEALNLKPDEPGEAVVPTP